jgi:hypothetical protein
MTTSSPHSQLLTNFKTATKYEFVKKWGSKGTGEGQFTVPYNVDGDSKVDVWVDDRENPRIQKFDKDVTFFSSWVLLVQKKINLITQNRLQ